VAIIFLISSLLLVATASLARFVSPGGQAGGFTALDYHKV
jgi:hypothetical protein